MVEDAVRGAPSLAPLARYLLPPILVDNEGLRHYKPARAAYNFVLQIYPRTPDTVWLVSSYVRRPPRLR